jgi:hypothetical protein
MQCVGLAGCALLAFVLLQAELPGLADNLEVISGPVLMYFLQQADKLGVDFVNCCAAQAGEVLG